MNTHTARVALYANESFGMRATNGTMAYHVAIVTENVAGYRRGRWFATVAEAVTEADTENSRMGLSRDDVLDIVASSMRQGGIR